MVRLRDLFFFLRDLERRELDLELLRLLFEMCFFMTCSAFLNWVTSTDAYFQKQVEAHGSKSASIFIRMVFTGDSNQVVSIEVEKANHGSLFWSANNGISPN